jgi:hypothetical protein
MVHGNVTNGYSLYEVQRVPKYTHFKKGKNRVKIVMALRFSNDNYASTIFFDCPACRMNAIFWANVLLHIATVIQFNFEK